MNRQLRLLIVIAFVVIILGVVAAFVLPQITGGDNADEPDDNTVGEVDPSQDGDGGGETVVLPTPEPILTTFIVIAIQNIPRGAEIPLDFIDIREIPLDFVPQNAIESDAEGTTALSFVAGQRARVDIVQEQPILANMLVAQNQVFDASGVGSDLSVLIPLDRRAVAVPVDRLTSVAYGVQPGDRVDIIVSFLFVEIDDDFQSVLPNDVAIILFDEGGNAIVGETLNGEVDQCTFQVPIFDIDNRSGYRTIALQSCLTTPT